MIQISCANNQDFNTSNTSLELKNILEQIASSENLREQIVNQIYIITDIQRAINNNTIKNNLDIFLSKYNKSIEDINGAIISKNDKLQYFDIEQEKKIYEKKQFTLKLATKCQEVEVVFDKIVQLNTQAIKDAKVYVSSKTNASDNAFNIGVNNLILSNNI
jgi:hypothetical protein